MNEDTPTTEPPRIELRVRHAVQPPVQDRLTDVREQLEQLEATDHIDGIDVEVWGTHIDLDPAAETTSHFEAYAEFAEWASSNDYELGPAFRLHRPRSMVSSKDYPVVTVPLVTLAVYDDSGLRAVYPHSEGDHVKTIEDGLRELAPDSTTLPAHPSMPQ